MLSGYAPRDSPEGVRRRGEIQIHVADHSRHHPEVELRANLESISHRCHLEEVAFVWELTKVTIHLPLGCLQGGCGHVPSLDMRGRDVTNCKRFRGLGLTQGQIGLHNPAKFTFLLRRNVKWFRGGLVLEAHTLLHHSSLGLRVINKRRRADVWHVS